MLDIINENPIAPDALQKYLYKLYGNNDPIYYLGETNLKQQLVQIGMLCDRFKISLKANKLPEYRMLQEKIDTLYDNIAKHVKHFDEFSEQEKSNIIYLCDEGKKQFEEIIFLVTQQSNNPNISDLITSFLHEDQISLCIGGVASIIQDYNPRFKLDFRSKIQNFSSYKIKYAAKKFITKFELLNFTNVNNILVRNNYTADHCEVHYLNNLYNSVAEKINWLNPITDAYVSVFPRGNWANLFSEDFSSNLLIDDWIDNFIDNLPQLPATHTTDSYKKFKNALNVYGEDSDFYIYDELQLIPNYKIATRASLVKRLVNSKLVQREPHEAKFTFFIKKETYCLYFIGSYSKFWFEHIDTMGTRSSFSFNTQLPSVAIQHIFSIRTLGNSFFTNLLFAAVAQDNVELLRILHNNKININCIDLMKRTALMIAIENHSLLCVKYILKFELCDINALDYISYTAPMMAAKYNSVSEINLLLSSKKLELNKTNDHGNSAISIATIFNNQDAVIALLDSKRIRTDILNNDGMNCLHIAVTGNQLGIAKALIMHNPTLLNSKNKDSYTALHLASRYGLEAMTEHLLSYENINPNLKNINEETAISIAIADMRVKIASTLLSDPRVKANTDGKKLKRIASEINNIEILYLLESIYPDEDLSSTTKARCQIM